MFEKEVFDKYMHDSADYYDPREPLTDRKLFQLWKDGAEFGYNKAKEEMQKNGLALQSDMDKTIEQNISLKAQIEKMKLCQNCKFLDNDCIEEPCSSCTRCQGNRKRKGNFDKWEIKE